MKPEYVLIVFAAIAAVVFVGIMLWDIRLYTDKTERNSITQSIIDYSKLHPWLPCLIGFLCGALCGHFYL